MNIPWSLFSGLFPKHSIQQISNPAARHQTCIRLASRRGPQGNCGPNRGVTFRRTKNLVQMRSFPSIVWPKPSFQRPVTCVHLPVISSNRHRVREGRLEDLEYGSAANAETLPVPCRCNALMAFRVTKAAVHRQQLEAPSLALTMCARCLRLSTHRV